ncbi:ABC transporter ATP-binding protein [Parafrankia sp. EUN1f]|uniref:ABC transporter ATP-binding protein n=1 Tax=Parafrankia sp. EUN1f TaxID=102897 RepID=UPI0001C45F64|nr:ABC transporter ATP-binding protein [Parafrankia sp. EUN1f]EFC81543.1 oligopeptide/dipeptide ABC transporter, ATPase subunit [Parafrankia sp. EUN1f]
MTAETVVAETVAGEHRPARGTNAVPAGQSPAAEPVLEPLLDVRGLTVSFRARSGPGRRTTVLKDVSLVVRPGEIVGVIGETGSGKTTLARAIAGLTRTDAGEVEVDGRDVRGLRRRARRDFRRSGAIRFVFQDPLRALDPDLTIGTSIAEGLAVAGRGSRDDRRAAVADALRRVGLDPAVADRLPGAISGGQRQRASIARAIVDDPRLLICDEPVSALDGSNRNLILRLLDGLRHQPADPAVPAGAADADPGRGRLGIIIISHDLSSLAGIADRVVVLYRGRVVEDGPIAEVFNRPRHPYTALLIASAPSIRDEDGPTPAQLRRSADGPVGERRPADACVFAHRCPFATEACDHTPAALPTIPGWTVACHHAAIWRGSLPAPRLPLADAVDAGDAGDAGAPSAGADLPMRRPDATRPRIAAATPAAVATSAAVTTSASARASVSASAAVDVSDTLTVLSKGVNNDVR